MKNIILFLGIFACLAGYADSPTPEDLLGKAYWDTLDIKSKPVFLMGFRHGAGLNTFGKTNLTLNEHEIPKIVPLIDSFYKVTDNRGVYLRSAIEICLMKLLDKLQAEIEK